MSRRSRAPARLTAACALAALFLAGRGFALPQDDARRLLAEMEAQQASRSQEYVGEVVTTSRSGRERHRVWKSYREGTGANTNRLIRFLSPPEVRGVAFLSRSRAGRPADQWMYLPSMKRERRIAAQDQDSPFVGTDFSYEDLEEFDRDRFDASLVPDATVDGRSCRVVKVVPRGRSSYAHRLLFIARDDRTLRRMDYFVAADPEPVKRLAFSAFAAVDGRTVALQMEMTDRRRGSRTTVRLTEVRFDLPQPADRYTIQNLVREGAEEGRRGPDREAGSVAGGSHRAKGLAGFRSPRWMTGFGSTGWSARPDSASAPATRIFGSGWSGHAEARALVFFTSATARDPAATGWATVLLRKEARAGRVRMAASLRAEAISSSERGPLAWDPADRLARRSPLSIREAWASFALAPAIDLQVGRFDLGWGRTDGYSPADGFLPRDLSDPLVSEKLPLWGARLQGERGAFRFEAFATPVTTPWRLPVLEGRYSPVSYAGYFALDATTPPPAGGFQMARLQRNGAAWDVGGWARTGVRPAPLLAPRLDEATVEDDQTFVPLDRRFARETAFGVEATRTIGALALRAEVASFSSDDPELGNAVIWAVEAEYPFRRGTLMATLAGNLRDTPIDPLLLFDRSFLPGVIIATHQAENWGSWKLVWFATVRDVGGSLTAEADYHLSDTVKLVVGTDLPHGSVIRSPGTYWRARRARTAIRWSW